MYVEILGLALFFESMLIYLNFDPSPQVSCISEGKKIPTTLPEKQKIEVFNKTG